MCCWMSFTVSEVISTVQFSFVWIWFKLTRLRIQNIPCPTVSFARPTAVLLSACTGVGGWSWPSLLRAFTWQYFLAGRTMKESCSCYMIYKFFCCNETTQIIITLVCFIYTLLLYIRQKPTIFYIFLYIYLLTITENNEEELFNYLFLLQLTTLTYCFNVSTCNTCHGNQQQQHLPRRIILIITKWKIPKY